MLARQEMGQQPANRVRALAEADVPAVARLFQHMLRKSRGPATPALAAYMTELFLNGPDRDPEINSHVHLDGDGTVNGFVGVLPMPMMVHGRPVSGALCGTLMVENHADDPFAGARLMRAFLAGPQDISLTETANDISTTMWRKLRGTVLPDHSLEWLRVIRPAGFVAAAAASAIRPMRAFAPLARPFDALIRRRPSSWAHVAAEIPEGTQTSAETDDEEAVDLFMQLTEPFAARPNWRRESLARMVAESRNKANYGEMVRRKVTARDGRTLGLFLYYGDPARIAGSCKYSSSPGRQAS
jgi:hypothetical protein